MSKESRNPIIFFIATFVWTWTFYGFIVVGGHNPYEMPWMIFLVLGGMAPSLVGVVMVLLMRDKQERRDYWRRCFSLKRIGILWWLVILFIFPVIYGLSIVIDVAMGSSLPGMDLLKSLVANPVTIPFTAFLSFMSGPWSEEFGWRGYALDRIVKLFGVIPGSIVLGLVWAVWHLPLYFMPATWHGQMGFQFSGFWTFMLYSVGLSLIMTWIYLSTHRSILAGMLLHFTANFTAQLLAPSTESSEIVKMVLILTVGCIACMLMNRRKQTHLEFERASLLTK
jgi:membrane protease YdiL (CAAX protease family)